MQNNEPLAKVGSIDELEEFKIDKATIAPLLGQSESKSISCFVTRLEAGKSVPKVKHSSCEEVVVVLDGDGTATVGNEVYPIKRGTFLYFPRAHPHSFSAGNDDLTMVCFLTPKIDKDKDLEIVEE